MRWYYLLDEDTSSLEKYIDTNDRGDDTQRRFRYQHAYAAIYSLKLLDEESEFIEMYCERLEDILMKRSDGKFAGMQIKTRETGQEPFKTMDSAVKKSLKRFFKLEKDLGNDFYRYVFVTNGGFWHLKKNYNNLSYLVKKVKNSSDSSILHDPDFSKILEIADGINGMDNDIIFSTLKKLELSSGGPGIDDIQSRLISLLPQYPDLADRLYPELFELSSKLISKMAEASSLAYTSPDHYYFVLSDDPQSSANAEVLEGKRMTRDKLLSTIQDFISDQAPLRTLDSINVDSLPLGNRKLERKMVAGEISMANINLAKDYKYSAEALFQKLLYKEQPGSAKELFDGLSLITRTECQEAFDIHFTEEEPFGHDMLQDVRGRIRHRHEQDCCHMFNGTYEHLMGIVSILTEECAVWWSSPFDILEEDQ